MVKFENIGKWFKNNITNIILVIIGIILSLLTLLSYFYITTPANIRYPEYEHLHFRMQIIVDGEAVDFAEDKYQENKPNVCSANITETPIHFHDKLDQFVHIHWRSVTGGQVMKYYGWNKIGGNNESLGRRFDQGILNISDVKTMGKLLPPVSENSSYFVYIGDEKEYKEKKWDDFIKQDLETFFEVKSNVEREENLLNRIFFKKAYAHEGHDHTSGKIDKGEEELKRINNLLGNIVIFVGDSSPTDEQIKAKFNNLVPLQDSSCGG